MKIKTRKSIRLQDYDYSRSGEYFITICVNGKENRLGYIINGESILTENGLIVEKWISKLSERFPVSDVEDYIIMPNHIHLIIEINITENEDSSTTKLPEKNETDCETWRVARTKMLLPKIINYLKTNASIEINRLNNEIGNKFWQSNYYEHIIRSEQEYFKISSYIKNNPSTWSEDRFNQPKNKKD